MVWHKLYSAILILVPLVLSNCSKIATVGEPPQMTHIKDPREVPGYEPIQMPMPEPTLASDRPTNSLWQTGSRAFFKDQRAGKVGDVLSVEVMVDRTQYMRMNPDIERTSTSKTVVNAAMGLTAPMQRLAKNAIKTLTGKAPPKAASASPTLADMSSTPVQKATATYDVQDKMQFTMSAVIIQILPNGNMVIQGREEVRLINELREIEIKGIIRREDINSNNKISSQKIANLRISYGGRGDLSDAQQAPWGQQYLNKLLPF